MRIELQNIEIHFQRNCQGCEPFLKRDNPSTIFWVFQVYLHLFNLDNWKYINDRVVQDLFQMDPNCLIQIHCISFDLISFCFNSQIDTIDFNWLYKAYCYGLINGLLFYKNICFNIFVKLSAKLETLIDFLKVQN